MPATHANIEHRIMYSIYFKTTERSDSTWNSPFFKGGWGGF
ncbi:hypothetical protein D1AOALGA4SA_12690 [Olavius algarvensis Delta 1 endosymbiont]|nr:hypothetical protein D1AOALGA4SA_12690 [Olavius algarvensis Delta 1 endosymbiont]